MDQLAFPSKYWSQRKCLYRP